MTATRRLAAILAADYARLIGEDEAGTVWASVAAFDYRDLRSGPGWPLHVEDRPCETPIGSDPRHKMRQFCSEEPAAILLVLTVLCRRSARNGRTHDRLTSIGVGRNAQIPVVRGRLAERIKSDP